MKKGVILVLSALTGAVFGACAVGKAIGQTVGKSQSKSDKHLALYLMMNQWVKIKQEGKNLATYFEKNEYKKIAVYGMSYAGKTLVNELRDTGVTVVYGIDQKADYGDAGADIDIVSADNDLEPVDAVVVTAITFFEEIEKKLSVKINCPILSLEDILYEL